MLFTYFLLFISYVSCEHPAHIRLNKINSDCDFNIIRIKKKNIICYDFGLNKNYCNHYAIPNEIIVTKEKGLNRDNIIIKPEKMYEEFRDNKVLMANLYYSFICNKYDSVPILELNIVPTKQYDLSFREQLFQTLFMISLLILLILLFASLCPCLVNNGNNYNDGLFSGLILGNCLSGNNNRRTYCE